MHVDDPSISRVRVFARIRMQMETIYVGAGSSSWGSPEGSTWTARLQTLAKKSKGRKSPAAGSPARGPSRCHVWWNGIAQRKPFPSDKKVTIFTAWGKYGKCSKACDGGKKFRHRTIISKESKCTVKLTESVKCNTNRCSKDCVVSAWQVGSHVGTRDCTHACAHAEMGEVLQEMWHRFSHSQTYHQVPQEGGQFIYTNTSRHTCGHALIMCHLQLESSRRDGSKKYHYHCTIVIITERFQLAPVAKMLHSPRDSLNKYR